MNFELKLLRKISRLYDRNYIKRRRYMRFFRHYRGMKEITPYKTILAIRKINAPGWRRIMKEEERLNRENIRLQKQMGVHMPDPCDYRLSCRLSCNYNSNCKLSKQIKEYKKYTKESHDDY